MLERVQCNLLLLFLLSLLLCMYSKCCNYNAANTVGSHNLLPFIAWVREWRQKHHRNYIKMQANCVFGFMFNITGNNTYKLIASYVGNAFIHEWLLRARVYHFTIFRLYTQFAYSMLTEKLTKLTSVTSIRRFFFYLSSFLFNSLFASYEWVCVCVRAKLSKRVYF